MIKYEIVIDPVNKMETLVRHNDDGTTSFIPAIADNSDYQEYLAANEASPK